jgi:hypothetical protein
MQPITPEQRAAALAEATPAQKWLYSDPVNGKKLYDIAVTHGITEAQYRDFAIYVGELILQLRNLQSLSQVVHDKEWSVTDVEQLQSTLTSFLYQSPDAPQDLSPQNATPPVDFASDIEETKEALQQLNTMRTMQSDQQQTTNNASNTTQNRAATQPREHTTSQPNTPRWESEDST